MESARIVAALVRIVRDVGLAEDMAHDALVAALEQWPAEGMPRNPGAWLMTTAQRRAIDVVRHRAMADRKHEQIAYEIDEAQPPPPTRRSTRTSATTCCVWCSSPATRCCRPRAAPR